MKTLRESDLHDRWFAIHGYYRFTAAEAAEACAALKNKLEREKKGSRSDTIKNYARSKQSGLELHLVLSGE
ncbi:hypothetical protein PPTG_21440 [Phytophthora nicotianae INRA-310]|uniref:Uncharacterized protein n=3 Tax=Phytophthora nicotianae TaxID=4792 RepID=W2R1T1_PHYN3|nr:hypothetical protein PPTG_21440 [Phytophthora nicotianae INRA-310]ETN19236.1 hypothetical protein PPTG_21440 [Phytophthora nicotianae INRA-310]